MKMTLEFSAEQLQTLNAALMLLPYGQVAPLIADINKQIQDWHNQKAADGPTGQTNPPDQFLGS